MITFPSSPTDGQEFLWGGVRYRYDATPGIWVGQLPQPDTVMDTATGSEPSNPIEGDLWYDSANMMLMVRTNDDWVEASPQPTAATQDLSVAENGTDVLTTSVTNINFVESGSVVTVAAGSDPMTDVDVTFDFSSLTAMIPNTPNAPAAPAMGMPAVPNVLTTAPGAEPTYEPVSSAVGVGDLNNVDTSTNPPMMGEALAYDGTNFVPTDLVENIGDLGDVSDTAPTDNQVLTYVDSANEWRPVTPTNLGNAVAINLPGNAITIDGTTTQVPVVTGMNVQGTTLTLQRNGATALTATLPSSGMTTTTPLTVGHISNVTTINGGTGIQVAGSSPTATLSSHLNITDSVFDDVPEATRLDLQTGLRTTASGSRANVTLDIPVQNSGTTLSGRAADTNPLTTLNFGTGLTASVSGNVATINATAGDLLVAQDQTTRATNPGTIDFTGNVTVTNRGSGRVEVNVPTSSGGGGGEGSMTNYFESTATNFQRSASRAFSGGRLQLTGGTTGRRAKLMMKNNSSNLFFVQYNFSGSSAGSNGNDNIADCRVDFTTSSSGGPAGFGLWNPDMERFEMFSVNSGGSNWSPGNDTFFFPQRAYFFEFDLKPNARVNFQIPSANTSDWLYYFTVLEAR